MQDKFSPDINKLNHINQQYFFLGTMHLAESSANTVQNAIETLKLDCVMIELDQFRYQNLLEKQDQETQEKKSPKQDHGTPQHPKNEEQDNNFMESLKEIQEGLGKILGITPGLEMIAAIDTVKAMEIPIMFIDRPINETFQRFQEIQED